MWILTEKLSISIHVNEILYDKNKGIVTKYTYLERNFETYAL